MSHKIFTLAAAHTQAHSGLRARLYPAISCRVNTFKNIASKL